MVAYGSARLYAYKKLPFLRCGIAFPDWIAWIALRLHVCFGAGKAKYRHFNYGDVNGLS